MNSNGEIEEWERPATIPDDFAYDPETDSYYAPASPDHFSFEDWDRHFKKIGEAFRNAPQTPEGQTRVLAEILSKDPSHQQQLGRKPEPELLLFRGLINDDDPPAEREPPMKLDPDRDESADDRS